MSFAPLIDTSPRYRAKSTKLPLWRGQSMSKLGSGSQDTRGSSDAILHLASLILVVIFSDLAAGNCRQSFGQDIRVRMPRDSAKVVLKIFSCYSCPV